MKSPYSGHTLAEMLVATALLATILTLSAAILETGRRSYSRARDNASMAATRDRALSTLSTALETLTFIQRPGFSPNESRLETESDQHFVCGSARGLLPEMKGLCGDAVFFQRQISDGTTQATGFFVRYGDDFPWRPNTLPNLKSLRRFRLLQFHQPAQELALYQPPQFSGHLDPAAAARRDVYQWFSHPLNRLTARNCHIVAENIIVMLIDTDSMSGEAWDTRRYQWDNDSPTAQKTRNRPPSEVTIHLMTVGDGAWGRLSEAESMKLALDIQSLCRTDRAARGQSSRHILQRLREKLEAQSIGCQITSIVRPIQND